MLCRALTTALGLALVGCGPTGALEQGAQEPGENTISGCVTKQDCLSGLVCVDGRCATPPASCHSSLECPDQQRCDPSAQVCVPPDPVPCGNDQDCAASGGADRCDPVEGVCVPEASLSPPPGDDVPGDDDVPGGGDAPISDDASIDTCLPEDEPCELSDDQCCDGFHCCPVFRICVLDWWD